MTTIIATTNSFRDHTIDVDINIESRFVIIMMMMMMSKMRIRSVLHSANRCSFFLHVRLAFFVSLVFTTASIVSVRPSWP